eukprot:gene17852-biopygen13824
MKCDVCEKRKPRETGATAIEDRHKFNDVVLLDSVLLGRLRGKELLALMMMDKATRLVAAGLLKDHTSKAAAVVFLHEWILRLGPPFRADTDVGSEFIGEAFRELCEEHGIKKIVRPAEWPDGHGMIERMNLTFQDSFRKIRDDRDFSSYEEALTALSTVVHVLNNTVYRGGFTASQAAF